MMDAAGSERAALIGWSEGGAMTMYPATYPERVRAIVFYGAYARYFTWVQSPDEATAYIEALDRGWGTGVTLLGRNPSTATDEANRRA
jgi:pimeloyl-ACP methyl ester carboxylesterase